jgi:glycosyltransferase involved in cell wall biosynthesis
VVASNISSIPEVVGESAVMIDPTDVESITAGIELGLTDSSLRKRLKNTGRVRAQLFTWEKTARQTWQIYREMVS